MTASGPLRVAHVLPSLTVGGVDTRRAIFAAQVRAHPAWRDAVELRFCALGGGGPAADRLRELGCSVEAFGASPHPLDLRTTARLIGWLRRERIALVHAAVFDANVHAALAQGWAGAPILVTEEVGSARWRPGWAHRLSGWAHRRAAQVIVPSRSVRDYLVREERVPESRVRLIYNCAAVDPVAAEARGEARRAFGAPNGEPIIGCISRLVPVKRHDVLLRAFARVRQRHPGARLVIVGDGPQRQAVAEQVLALGMDASVQLLGQRRDIAQLLSGFDVFALASDTEGLPVAVVEAMLSRVPVVATAADGMLETLRHEDTGLLVPTGDDGAMAEGILRYLGDRGFAGGVAARAQAEARARFAPERYAAELVDLYATLAKAHDRG